MRLRFRTFALCSIAVGLFVAAGAFALGSRDASAPPVTRKALAQQVDPVGAPGRTLGLSKVRVAPGARIALHHHPGTQLAYIQHGVLTYTVRTGSVDVMRGPADQSPKVVRTITAG